MRYIDNPIGYQAMYKRINQNINHILDKINPEKDVKPYVWLIQNFAETNVASDREYQGIYRQYWRLNGAGLCEEFCQAYFSMLEELKHAENKGVKTVVLRLFEVPSNKTGKKKLHFSFASKLVHMLDHNLPVYDSRVKKFFSLSNVHPYFNNDRKLNRLLESYNFLIEEYACVLADGILARPIKLFRERFSVGSEYSDNKIIDTLIWRYDMKNMDE